MTRLGRSMLKRGESKPSITVSMMNGLLLMVEVSTCVGNFEVNSSTNYFN
jgi:hypothetical protein